MSVLIAAALLCPPRARRSSGLHSAGGAAACEGGRGLITRPRWDKRSLQGRAENPQTNEERLLQREQADPSMDGRNNGAEGSGGVGVCVSMCAFDV